MTRSFPTMLFAMLALSACGGNHQLQSVTLSPPTADAQSFPNGQVQFVAKGTFSDSSMPVTLTSKDILWCYGGVTSVASSPAGVCAGNIAQFATVDQNGLAQCANSFQGSVYILAGTTSGPVVPDMGPALKVFGSAVLTCP